MFFTVITSTPDEVFVHQTTASSQEEALVAASMRLPHTDGCALDEEPLATLIAIAEREKHPKLELVSGATGCWTWVDAPPSYDCRVIATRENA